MKKILFSDLEVTGGVDEQIGGLQVSVKDVGRVNVLQPTQDLVQKVADMIVAELLGLQQLVQVCLHQVLHNVAAGSQGINRLYSSSQG